MVLNVYTCICRAVVAVRSAPNTGSGTFVPRLGTYFHTLYYVHVLEEYECINFSKVHVHCSCVCMTFAKRTA